LNGTHPINKPLIKSKKVIGTEIHDILCYPEFNKPFHLYTDASDHQLGAVIMQDKKQYNYSLLFAKAQYSSKPGNNHWKRQRVFISYWNLQGIQEYPVRLPSTIIVFTDHKNNTFNGLKASDRVLMLWWLLLLEEYGVSFEYLLGKMHKNNVADTLSRLEIDSLKIQEEEVLTLLSGSENNSISNIKLTMHTALIFKEQAKVKEPVLREKGLAKPHYSI
jgi:hypothetical protein